MFQATLDVWEPSKKKLLTFGRASHAWAIDRSAAPWVSLWISTSMTSPTSGVLMTDQRSTFLGFLRFFEQHLLRTSSTYIKTSGLHSESGKAQRPQRRYWACGKYLKQQTSGKRNIRTEGELLFAAPTSLFCKYQGLARSKTPCWCIWIMRSGYGKNARVVELSSLCHIANRLPDLFSLPNFSANSRSNKLLADLPWLSWMEAASRRVRQFVSKCNMFKACWHDRYYHISQ